MKPIYKYLSSSSYNFNGLKKSILNSKTILNERIDPLDSKNDLNERGNQHLNSDQHKTTRSNQRDYQVYFIIGFVIVGILIMGAIIYKACSDKTSTHNIETK